jgi:hypothetical protein
VAQRTIISTNTKWILWLAKTGGIRVGGIRNAVRSVKIRILISKTVLLQVKLISNSQNNYDLLPGCYHNTMFCRKIIANRCLYVIYSEINNNLKLPSCYIEVILLLLDCYPKLQAKYQLVAITWNIKEARLLPWCFLVVTSLIMWWAKRSCVWSHKVILSLT